MEKDLILICDVRTSYFSIARYSGGATINGNTFKYYYERDILVRKDWCKFYERMPWSDFVAAVKSGVKPELPSKRKVNEQQKSPSIPSLFD